MATAAVCACHRLVRKAVSGWGGMQGSQTEQYAGSRIARRSGLPVGHIKMPMVLDRLDYDAEAGRVGPTANDPPGLHRPLAGPHPRRGTGPATRLPLLLQKLLRPLMTVSRRADRSVRVGPIRRRSREPRRGEKPQVMGSAGRAADDGIPRPDGAAPAVLRQPQSHHRGGATASPIGYAIASTPIRSRSASGTMTLASGRW